MFCQIKIDLKTKTKHDDTESMDFWSVMTLYYGILCVD